MPQTTRASFQGRSLCLEHVCPTHPKSVRPGLNLGTWKARENLDAVVGEELYGVACCIESGIVLLQYSAIRLMPEIKQPSPPLPWKKVTIFEHACRKLSAV